jgi:predicted GTPase
LERHIEERSVDAVIFAYSDVSQQQVMHLASRVLAAGADFQLLGPRHTMLRADVPVIAVSAVRTGCGKSQVSRWLSQRLMERGVRSAVIRHPMPYGDLERQAVQRFSSLDDLDAADCTIEEREEYEPHIRFGNTVFAGLDYARIVELAAKEADLILWDGGNNDFPFIRPDLHIVLVDPLRPGHETTHHPGETVLRMADLVIIAKTDAAADRDVRLVMETVQRIRPGIPVIEGSSPITLENTDAVRGKRVLVVEDGPTITHGGMSYGAGYVAAVRAGAATIVDPRTSAVPAIREVYDQYPHIGNVLPAIGYHDYQLDALCDTINASDAELVVTATPCDLERRMHLNKPVVCARYEFAEVGTPSLTAALEAFLRREARRIGR